MIIIISARFLSGKTEEDVTTHTEIMIASDFQHCARHSGIVTCKELGGTWLYLGFSGQRALGLFSLTHWGATGLLRYQKIATDLTARGKWRGKLNFGAEGRPVFAPWMVLF